jgi:hypothetical protein
MNEKKIIYFGFNQERSMAVEYLYKQYSWIPICLYSSPAMKNEFEKKYPDALFCDGVRNRKGHFDYTDIGDPIPIDKQIINTLAEFEVSSFNLLEDTTGWNFSHIERREYYYLILKYWNTIIHYKNPEIMVFWSRPHTITEYVPYLLAKHIFSIPVLFIEATPHFNSYYHAITSDLESFDAPFRERYNSFEKISLHSEVKVYLEELRSKKGKQPDFIIERYKKASRINSFMMKNFLILVLKTLFFGFGFKESKMAFKKNRKSFFTSKSQLTEWGYFWFKNKLRTQALKLNKLYNKLVIDPDFNKSFIYFAAPYQPESTTCPNGGVYSNVLLALDVLASSIPEDWIIYYKENPATFMGGGKGALARNEQFYKRLNAYKNVEIISVDVDTYQLIDESKAVASITGTACWESVVRGVPAIFFGNCWYQGCKSLFRIKTFEDCKLAIRKIEKGYLPNQNDIEKYVWAMQESSVKGLIHRNFSERIKACSDPKTEMERIGRAFFDAYERFYLPKERISKE